MTSVSPPEPHKLRFLQRTACAYADDVAPVMGSFRVSLRFVAEAFAAIDQVTGMSLNCCKCHWIRSMNDYARCSSVMIGAGGAAHTCHSGDCPINVCARTRPSSQSLVQRVVAFEICPFSVLRTASLRKLWPSEKFQPFQALPAQA